jgi:hypothetical protein
MINKLVLLHLINKPHCATNSVDPDLHDFFLLLDYFYYTVQLIACSLWEHYAIMPNLLCPAYYVCTYSHKKY